MKVLVINGSPRANQCTATALDEVIKTLQAEGVETELIHVGKTAVRGCIACNYCRTHGKCVFNDIVNETAKKFEEADGIIIGTALVFGPAVFQHAFLQTHEGRRGGSQLPAGRSHGFV